MRIRIEAVRPEVTFPLRRQVLRPFLATPEQTVLPGEREPGALHLAAYDGDGAVVGTAVLVRERFPRMPDRADAWRLRGMATDERLRSQGLGTRLIRRMIDHVAASGGGLLWCNARVPAQAFYQRAGFEAVGAVWTEPQPHLGPHVAMWREVEPATSATPPDVLGRPG